MEGGAGMPASQRLDGRFDAIETLAQPRRARGEAQADIALPARPGPTMQRKRKAAVFAALLRQRHRAAKVTSRTAPTGAP